VEPPPGRIGKYSVIRRIASGGMAEVYLCRFRGEEGFEKKVAVKRILPRFSSEPRFRELFVREARTAASLVHPNLVQVFDFGREGESYYLAMEFIEGWNLAQVLTQARARGVSIPLQIWGHWIGGILSGIGHLHSKGILHRDISPSNVLLSRGGFVKITDFGISSSVLHRVDSAEPLEGKFAYLSPERARGENADKGSDLFAAGLIAAEIYLPNRMFASGSPAETIESLKTFDVRNADLSALPQYAEGIVRKALAVDPNERYRDAEDFSQAVRSAVPRAAGTSEIRSVWTGIFPDDGGDEETIPSFSVVREAEADLVRERRQDYGNRARRRAGIGILSLIAVISAGGYGLWKGLAVGPGQTAFSPPPAENPGRITPSEEPDRANQTPPPGDVRVETRSREAATVPDPPSRSVFIETEPRGVSISLENGTSLGKTPIGIDMTPWLGKNIVFHKEGYVVKNVRADHLAQVKRFRLELERQMGSIEVIQAIPWAKVYEENRYFGDTPIHGLKLPIGVHRLRFVNEPLAVEKTREVSVQPGANPKVIVPLVEKGPGE